MIARVFKIPFTNWDISVTDGKIPRQEVTRIRNLRKEHYILYNQ